MDENRGHRAQVHAEFTDWLGAAQLALPAGPSLRVDLHCHDHNSDVTDELWGRILRLPETWLPTQDLLDCLESHGTGAVTITNHNNARSCWELLERGHDVLPGAEFTCTLPDTDVSVHVLAYGFTPAQEERLDELRRELPRFLDYTAEHDIPLVLPHPLYLYHPQRRLDPTIHERFALMFSRFEGLNGQRDVLQNLLAVRWVEGLDPQRLEDLGRKWGIPPGRWCKDPYEKVLTGGSDDHMGIFAGGTGTVLTLPDLVQRLARGESRASVALEALRHGKVAPYGDACGDERLRITLLDYFCQVAMHQKDAGLVRMMLHRGTVEDKLFCLAITNGIHELTRHKFTMKFLRTFHEALRGTRPGLLASWTVGKDYKPMLAEIDRIARARRLPPAERSEALRDATDRIFHQLNELLSDRIASRFQGGISAGLFAAESLDELVRRFEVPSHARSFFDPPAAARTRDMSAIDVPALLENLSFPALASALLGAGSFAASRVMWSHRGLVTAFAEAVGGPTPQKRALWLTDSLTDKNGISTVLRAMHEEVCRRDLPIDLLVCSDTAQPGPHLHVLPPIGRIPLANLSSDQVLHVPDVLEVQRLFAEHDYDRIVCSTEFPMGLIALFLKQAFKVPASFLMHTDWLDYARRTTSLEQQGLDRVRRMLRAMYQQFDKVFVLNSEHRDWLTSDAIGLSEDRVKLTAHWPAPAFRPQPSARPAEGGPVLLFVGRLSDEKGVHDLPAVLARVRRRLPTARLRVAGSGPAEEALRAAVPDGEFLGWLPGHALPVVMGAADFLVLPSRFDTFGLVCVEAMATGLPVAAFATKGPGDIVRHGMDGVLAETAEDLGDALAEVLASPARVRELRRGALERARHFAKDRIVDAMLADLGLVVGETAALASADEREAVAK